VARDRARERHDCSICAAPAPRGRRWLGRGWRDRNCGLARWRRVPRPRCSPIDVRGRCWPRLPSQIDDERKLAEATAAQLGFEYEIEPPFSGRKGRTRLAVIDGVVNEAVVRIIASALGDRERVVVCGTGIDTDARPILRELRPGSTLRKIPAALLDDYRSSRQLRLDLADTGAVVEVADSHRDAIEVTT